MFQNLNERERQVLEVLMDDPGASVTEMGRRIEVSAVTIRSTLNSLAEKGVIVRTWGGASPAFHPGILERQRTRHEAKVRIARHAASLVDEDDTIMVEAGTTTSLIGRFLFGKRVHVVTNSMLFVPYGRANPALTVTVVGGSLQPATESMVGPIALRQLDQFFVSTAFIGTDGFSLEHGTTTHHVEGAEIVRRMSTLSQRTVLLADSSKYGRTGFARVLDLSDADLVISDTDLPQEAAQIIRESGVELELV